MKLAKLVTKLVRGLGRILVALWDGLNVWHPICLLCRRPSCDFCYCPIAKIDITVGALLEDMAYRGD